MLATAVSAANDCFYCMDSHGAFASALLLRSGADDLVPVVDHIKRGSSEGLDEKMQALLHIARTVQRQPLDLAADDIADGPRGRRDRWRRPAAVLIAAGFSMYNRLVEGFRAHTPPTAEVYRERAGEIAEHGYSSRQVTAVPG